MPKRALPTWLLVLTLLSACGSQPSSEPQRTATPETAAPGAGGRPEPQQAALPGMDKVLALYLGQSEQLADDSFDRASATQLAGAVDELELAPAPSWLPRLRETARAYAEAEDLSQARLRFGPLSELLIDYVEQHQTSLLMHKAYCSMAPEGVGGAWLQTGEQVRNPWYGSGMLTCGELQW